MILHHSLPIAHPRQLTQSLATWHNTLKNNVRQAQPSPTPLNFTVTNSQGGLQLSWAPVQRTVVKQQIGVQEIGPDGYEIWRSPSGSFTSDLTVIKVPGAQSSQYFDSIGSVATQVFYRIYSTSGTPHEPQSTRGAPSGVVANTSIIPTDTVTVPTVARDTYTNDAVRATSSRGNYGIQQYNFFPGVK